MKDITHKIDSYLNDKNDLYITENKAWDYIKDLKNKTDAQIKKLLKSSWQKLYKMIKQEDKEKEALDIINRALKTKINSFNQLKESKLDEVLTADPEKAGFVNWLKSIGFQTLMTGSIFTGLQIFFALDSLLDGQLPDIKRVLVYGFLFLILSTKLYKDWKVLSK